MGGATDLGPAAAQTMLSFGTWRAGHCLEAVVAAYRAVGVPSLGRPAPTAYVGWQNSDDKHHGDRNPPVGVPVWWGPKPSSAAGDVVISLGGGRVVATDWPTRGRIGITTIDARERQIGRPYLGWTGDILGAPIYKPNPITTPDESEEDDMAVPKQNSGFIYTNSRGDVTCLIANTTSGFYHEYVGGYLEYNNNVAAAFDTGNFEPITESHAAAIKTACDRVLDPTITLVPLVANATESA